MRKLLLALLMVTFVAMPAFASVQNVKVSGDIDSSWVARNNFDLGAGADGIASPSNGSETSQNFLMTQTRLRVDADLTDNVSTTVGLINERPWTTDSTTSTDIDLNLAYVTLREMLYSPLTVVAGRQVFHYGNSFVVDATGQNNSAPTDSGITSVAGDLTKQTAQDAVRLIFDYNPLKLELLASKIDARTLVEADDRDDIDLYGLNATYDLGDNFKTQVEGYFFARINKVKTNNSVSPGATTPSKNDTVYVPGVRISTNPIEGLNVQGELAIQRGTKVLVTSGANAARANQKREAVGAEFIANYKLPMMEEYKPVAQYVYSYTSGDHNPSSAATGFGTDPAIPSGERWTAWDPMFENQGGGTIYNTLYSLTNSHIHIVSLQVNPMEDVTVKGTWTGLWLDRELDSTTLTVTQPDGTSRTLATKRDETALGNEIDISADYAYTEDVTLGANVGWYFPGDVFGENNDSIASQAIVHANVNF